MQGIRSLYNLWKAGGAKFRKATILVWILPKVEFEASTEE